MKNLFFLLIIITFSSCYTLQKAQKQVEKAHSKFPIVTSGFCAETFPVKVKITEKTKFIKGDTIVKKETITVDCDSVVSDNTKSNKVFIKYKTIYQTDTIVKTKTITKENTAKVKNLELQVEKLEAIQKTNETTISNLEDKNSSLLKYLIFSLIANIVLVIIVIKK